MRHETYSCNFCGGAITRDSGVGLEFAHNPKLNPTRTDKLSLEVGHFEKVERHLCLSCLTDITRIGIRYNSDESDSK